MSMNSGSDLPVLFAFINQHMGTASPLLKYRDLDTYFLQKFMCSYNLDVDVKRLAENALTACQLDTSGTMTSDLNDPGAENRRAAAAAVLASSIVKALPLVDLISLYRRLEKAGEQSALQELKNVLTYGDVWQSLTYPRLSLKNFTSAGWQKRDYCDKTIKAYGRAEQMLEYMNVKFLAPKYKRYESLSPHMQFAFQKYFGKAHAKQVMGNLPFLVRITDAAESSSHFGIVRRALRRVYTAFASKDPLRIYFGGKGLTVGDQAYTRPRSDKPTKDNPTRIHVSSTFFEGTHIDTRAGFLIHEFGHAWCYLDDHAYGDSECQDLAKGHPTYALTNADNYAWFVKAAFGPAPPARGSYADFS